MDDTRRDEVQARINNPQTQRDAFEHVYRGKLGRTNTVQGRQYATDADAKKAFESAWLVWKGNLRIVGLSMSVAQVDKEQMRETSQKNKEVQRPGWIPPRKRQRHE